MPLERYEILLPLKYNDGTPVEPEKFRQKKIELVEKFGAIQLNLKVFTASGHMAVKNMLMN